MDDFTSVHSDHEGPLPDERPLLIEGRPTSWFLHSNGGVTKCTGNHITTEFSKCEEEKDFPAVLHSEEEVHKALSEVFTIFA